MRLNILYFLFYWGSPSSCLMKSHSTGYFSAINSSYRTTMVKFLLLAVYYVFQNDVQSWEYKKKVTCTQLGGFRSWGISCPCSSSDTAKFSHRFDHLQFVVQNTINGGVIQFQLLSNSSFDPKAQDLGFWGHFPQFFQLQALCCMVSPVNSLS